MDVTIFHTKITRILEMSAAAAHNEAQRKTFIYLFVTTKIVEIVWVFETPIQVYFKVHEFCNEDAAFFN